MKGYKLDVIRKSFRYVIDGVAYDWQYASDVTLGKMIRVGVELNKMYGNNWYVEFKDGE